MFEWDEEKKQTNFSDHGLSFEDAETVFSGECVTFEDTRYDYGEPRFVTLGRLRVAPWSLRTRHAARTHGLFR